MLVSSMLARKWTGPRSSVGREVLRQLGPEGKAAERREAAKDRVEKIKRGENVEGGLGKRIDLRAMLKGILTPDQFRRVELVGSLRKAEFETLLDDAHLKRVSEAGDKVADREARRTIRARKRCPSPAILASLGGHAGRSCATRRDGRC